MTPIHTYRHHIHLESGQVIARFFVPDLVVYGSPGLIFNESRCAQSRERASLERRATLPVDPTTAGGACRPRELALQLLAGTWSAGVVTNIISCNAAISAREKVQRCWRSSWVLAAWPRRPPQPGPARDLHV